MQFIADFHIHSKYSRATSPKTDLPNLAKWAKVKGIDLLGTGDCTHNEWLCQIRDILEPAESGLYKLKSKDNNVRFVITGEISCIYKKKDKIRKVHILIIMPSIEAAERLNKELLAIGSNLKSDGRPILGLDAKELLKICLAVDNKCLFIPAHCLTPWFGVFGSKSGFDSLEECFEELTPHILAVESGLSANPSMIWRIPDGNNVAIISNSDAHSSEKIGREANVFETDFSYEGVYDAIKTKDNKKFLYTIEFYPEEGKYHFDGHRSCNLSLSPEESYEYREICPICNKKITIGVLNRVSKIADKPVGYIPEQAIPFKSLVPLKEIIAEFLHCKETAKKAIIEYEKLIENFDSEFNVLLNVSIDDLAKVSGEKFTDGIKKIREGKINIVPGYDGEYGIVSVFSEPKPRTNSIRQKKLI
ncbi:MAG: endonuclease Q family protein [Candidatus Pacebacteria bacterium]|nr:endonuclease Q family protein [Candidatus Paceibacterota bacterium]